MDSVDISRLTAEELWTRLLQLAKIERGATCDLVETLAEIDRRGLHKDHEYVSLFECCVHKLGFSEAAAYRRIRAARALKLFPPIAPLLRQGRLTLESIALLHPFLNDADAASLVSAAAGKRVWEVECLVAGRRTEAPRRDVVRFIAPKPRASPPADDAPLLAPASAIGRAPEPTPSEPLLAPTPAFPTAREPKPSTPSLASEPAPADVRPSAPSPAEKLPDDAPGVRIAFTADDEFFRLLRQAQAVMRHKYPNGRLDGIFRDALQALLRRKTPWAFAPAKR